MNRPTGRRGRPKKEEAKKRREREKRNRKKEKDIVITLPTFSDDEDDYRNNSSSKGKGNNKSKNNDSDDSHDYYTINHSDGENDLGYISDDVASNSNSNSNTNTNNNANANNGEGSDTDMGIGMDYGDDSDDADVYKELREQIKMNKKLISENQELREEMKEMKKKGSKNNSLNQKELKKAFTKCKFLSLVNGKNLVMKSKSDSACVHCTLDIQGLPWMMPVAYIGGSYYIDPKQRAFCSPSCMLRYNERILKDHRQKIRHGLIVQLYQEIFDTDEELQSALDPEDCLKKFGGQMTNNKYRMSLNILTNDPLASLPIMIPCITAEEARKAGIEETELE